MKPRIGRTCHHAGTEQRPHVLHGTWLEAEAFAYPAGGFTRRAYVELRPNPNNPIRLPYGLRYMVRCAIPDTYFSIPARFRYNGRRIDGFISVTDPDTETARYTFTPEGIAQATA